MKKSLLKFISLSLCISLLFAVAAVAETHGLQVAEGNSVETEAIEFTDIPANDIKSDADEDASSDAEIKSDADEIITSDAEIKSDADDVVSSDAKEETTPSTPPAPSVGGSSGSGSSAGAPAKDEDDKKEDEEKAESDMALNFTDLSADDWAYGSILNLVKKGIVSGDTIGTIRPDGNVTREEVAKMMVVARKFSVAEDVTIEAADSDSVSDWAKGYFKTAMERGIITGYTDGSVRGTGEVNRAEMATIIVRSINASIDSFTASSFADITEADWYAKYVECAKTLGIVNGYQDGSFKGEALVTRREAFAMIERMVRLLEALEA